MCKKDKDVRYFRNLHPSYNHPCSFLLMAAADFPLLRHSYKRGVPGLELLEKTIISTLEAGKSERLEFYVEYMDLSRFEDEEYQRRLYDLYQRKYSALDMDLLIPLQIQALNFLLQHGEKMFPGAPIVFSGVLEKNLDRGTAEILKLHPSTLRARMKKLGITRPAAS
ncbi:MAG: hypothetical protein GY801_47015 [bacterium]|nr:hypothetical protein [bacterium]